jgi:rhodanese-related sulfurtransferase
VYGATEDDTFQAGTRLFDMGFIGLRTITGGFAAWNKQGLPTEPSHQP